MKVKNVIIVGGGTSGWMAAAYLYNNNPELTVTVIDKEIGTPIGVGIRAVGGGIGRVKENSSGSMPKRDGVPTDPRPVATAHPHIA